jgi:plastocyanin
VTLIDDTPHVGPIASEPEAAEVVHEVVLASGTHPRTGNRGLAVAIFVAGLGLALLLAAVAYLVASDQASQDPAASPAEPASFGVVIPKGLGKRIASGYHYFLIPEDLQLHVGDSLVVVNDDTQVHEVGPFFVRPGETLTHTFTEPGTFIGACTFHPVGQVKIEIFPVDVPIAPPSIPENIYG